MSNIDTTEKEIKNERKWIFPDHIKFEEVPVYAERLKEQNLQGNIIFDLSETINIHSSFIGFLIHAKHNIEKKDGNLLLLLSSTVEKILIMLNIMDYFLPEIEVNLRKEIA